MNTDVMPPNGDGASAKHMDASNYEYRMKYKGPVI